MTVEWRLVCGDSCRDLSTFSIWNKHVIFKIKSNCGLRVKLLIWKENISFNLIFKHWTNQPLLCIVFHGAGSQTQLREYLWHDVNYITFICSVSYCSVWHCSVRPHTGLHHTVTHEWNTFVHVNTMELTWDFIIISALKCVCVCL